MYLYIYIYTAAHESGVLNKLSQPQMYCTVSGHDTQFNDVKCICILCISAVNALRRKRPPLRAQANVARETVAARFITDNVALITAYVGNNIFTVRKCDVGLMFLMIIILIVVTVYHSTA